MGPVDVVTVADFDGPAAARFELRTLLFLGAWMHHTGLSRSWPVHLVCIGTPPESVRREADRAGADVTIHAPLLYNPRRNSNKLRAFDVRPKTDRLLLLDTDVLVLRDLAPLAAFVGSGIGVGEATLNYLAEAMWRRIYDTVGVPYPGPTGTCWCANDRLAERRGLSPDQIALCRRTPPFFNSGVVLVPWALDLGARWRRHHERIAQLLEEHPLQWPGERVISDEPALATVTEELRQEGTAVVTIRWPYHTRPLLLRAGAIRWREIAIFHYHNALNPYALTVDDLQGLLYGSRYRTLRRWAAGRLGLRAVRSPLYRRVPTQDLRAFGEFYAHVYQLSQTLPVRPQSHDRGH